jgi:hypothetical protein
MDVITMDVITMESVMQKKSSPSAQLFSGHLKAGDGFNAPVPFAGPAGWTVFKKTQTELYEVRHNLHLTDPAKQLHVAVTAMSVGVLPVVTKVAADTFTIETYLSANGAATETDLMFVATYYPA